jgi:outer membrane protein assembly factor BamB
MNLPLKPSFSRKDGPAFTPFILIVVVALNPWLHLARAEWPNWRGPAGNGSSATGSFPTRWTPETVAWKYALPGKGGSTPVISRDRVYLTTPADGEDAVLALDLAGKLIWQTKLGKASPPKHRTLGSSCNASPVFDGKNIFAYFRSGRLVSLNPNGSVRWKLDLTERFGADNLFWDQGSSPLVTDTHVILPRLHGGDSWVAGFDKVSGELRWRTPRNFKVPTENDNGYTTPVPFQHAGRPAFLIWGADHLTAYEVADGKLIWTCAGFNPDGTGYWPAIASPVIHENLAIVPVGRDDRAGQARVHAVRLDGQGDVTATHRAWQREDVGVFVTTPAAAHGKIYLLRHRGEVICLDPKSGQTIWANAFPRGTSSFYASPIIANNLLYAAREDGVVFTARVGTQFAVVGENPMGERIVASPAVAHGRLWIRGDKHLYCVGPTEVAQTRP